MMRTIYSTTQVVVFYNSGLQWQVMPCEHYYKAHCTNPTNNPLTPSLPQSPNQTTRRIPSRRNPTVCHKGSECPASATSGLTYNMGRWLDSIPVEGIDEVRCSTALMRLQVGSKRKVIETATPTINYQQGFQQLRESKARRQHRTSRPPNQASNQLSLLPQHNNQKELTQEPHPPEF